MILLILVCPMILTYKLSAGSSPVCCFHIKANAPSSSSWPSKWWMHVDPPFLIRFPDKSVFTHCSTWVSYPTSLTKGCLSVTDLSLLLPVLHAANCCTGTSEKHQFTDFRKNICNLLSFWRIICLHRFEASSSGQIKVFPVHISLHICQPHPSFPFCIGCCQLPCPFVPDLKISLPGLPACW